MSSNKYIEHAGSYECIVEDPGETGWFGESGEKKTPFIRIPVRVSEGVDKGKIAVYRAWLSDSAFDNTIRRLKEVFGFDGDLNALFAGKTTFTDLPCNIQTEMETYQGKAMCKVAWLNPPGGGGGGAAPMEASKLSSLLSRLGPKAKAIAKATPVASGVQAGGTRTVSGNTVTQEVDASSDDVPF